MIKIPYGKQFIDNEDILSVKKSLSLEKITTGNKVKIFEDKISKFTKAKYTVVCSSGTSALYLALKSIKIKRNDVVIMPSVNFIAAYNVSKLNNAKIYLADVDPLSGQLTPNLLQECIKKNRIKNIKCVINMYLGGSAQNIDKFYFLKKKYNFFLIEDACHAFGSKYIVNNKRYIVGSCKHSDICTFSFHPLKSITTGEGGAITTNKKNIYKLLKLYRSHGILRGKSHWEYNVTDYSMNHRLSDINCALGISQLKKIKKFIQKRQKIIKDYASFLSKYNEYIKIPKTSLDTLSSGHLFVISVNFKKLKGGKNKMLNFFKKERIYLQQHYIPIYKFSVYKSKMKKKLINTEYYYKNSVSLPIFFDFNKFSQLKFFNCFKNYIKRSGTSQ